MEEERRGERREVSTAQLQEHTVVIIGCGGTIAGKSASAQDMTQYKSGALTVEGLMADLPWLADYGPLEGHSFGQYDSSDIGPKQWAELAILVRQYAARPEVDGIVITHGTDTMEETAYFLHLTVATDKPVVITGAMRPSTAISADGPANLLGAIICARSEACRGLGVLQYMNGSIESARDVVKRHTTDLGTFNSGPVGSLGLVQEGQPWIYRRPARTHTADSDFAKLEAEELRALPTVDILFVYPGMSDAYLEAIGNLHPAGLVIAGAGHGCMPKNLLHALPLWPFVKVRASRTGSGLVTARQGDRKVGLVAADSLVPTKARILLMLALARYGQDYDAIVQAFGEY